MMYMHTTTITVKKITSLFKQETVGQHLIGVHVKELDHSRKALVLVLEEQHVERKQVCKERGEDYRVEPGRVQGGGLGVV